MEGIKAFEELVRGRSRPVVIALEGLSGAGKSTQALLLNKALADIGLETRLGDSKISPYLKELYDLRVGIPYSERTRYGDDLQSIWRVYFKHHSILHEQVTAFSGDVFIRDRSIISVLTYLRAFGYSPDDSLESIERLAGDLTLFLDVDPALSVTRSGERRKTWEALHNIKYVKNLKEEYLRQCERGNLTRLVGTNEIGQVHEDICGCVEMFAREALDEI